MKMQLNLQLIINPNEIKDLKKISKLIKEGWKLIHLNVLNENENNKMKAVFIRKL